MPTQSELFTAAPADPGVAWLEDLLKAHKDWMTAADLRETDGGRKLGNSFDRHLRTFASASQWIISGQRGYKHIEHATAEEINHAANWLESQAKQMTERAIRIRKAAHGRIG